MRTPMLRTRILAVIVSAALLPVACKSTEGHDRAADTADQVTTVGASAAQTQLRLDATLAAMEKIVATAKQDPKPAFDTFVKELESFNSTFAGLTGQREALKTKSETWFTEFQKQNDAIQDAELRKDGAKRLDEFKSKVGDLSKQVDELMTGTTSLQGRLKDLRTFLGNDLTPKGIETVSGRVEDSAKEGRKLAAGFGKLSKTSDSLASSMRAARAPAQP